MVLPYFCHSAIIVNNQNQTEKIPNHIAIIMDGNGRWAKEKGKDRIFGHYEGVLSVRSAVEACAEVGVKYLTLYAFSTENWNRPKEEVNALMELLVTTLNSEIESLHKNNVKLHVIGDFKSLPQVCQDQLNWAMQLTQHNSGLNVVLALSYSAKWEIATATKAIAQDVQNGTLNIEDITEDTISKYLNTAHLPDPELMIRTSGECRISNFLLYQLAYAELYFTPVHWPDFRKEHLLEAIADYQNRERRFGKTSDQIIKNEVNN
jgi:undecaprenyl diphosphate synthase